MGGGRLGGRVHKSETGSVSGRVKDVQCFGGATFPPPLAKRTVPRHEELCVLAHFSVLVDWTQLPEEGRHFAVYLFVHTKRSQGQVHFQSSD